MTAQEAVEACALLCDRLADGYLDEAIVVSSIIDYDEDNKALIARSKFDAFRSAAHLIREQIGEKLR